MNDMTPRTAAKPSRSARKAPTAAPTLRVRTLGAREVLVNDAAAEWHAASARDLFFYLLSFPEGRTREEILEGLWELESDAASGNRFRVTLHRLRGALGWPESVVEEYGRYRLAPEIFRASDVHDVYAGLRDADLASVGPEKLAALQRALGAYSGDYLPGESAEWATQAREEHRAAYVRACVELSLLHCERAECGGAVSALVRALRADPFIGENYHQKLMTCLSVVEGKYAAIEHYRRFIKFLRDDLGDTPMDETTELAARIKTGEHICVGSRGTDATLTLNCPLTPDGHCPGVLGELLQLE